MNDCLFAQVPSAVSQAYPILLLLLLLLLLFLEMIFFQEWPVSSNPQTLCQKHLLCKDSLLKSFPAQSTHTKAPCGGSGSSCALGTLMSLLNLNPQL
jgi:hypothetical protein